MPNPTRNPLDHETDLNTLIEGVARRGARLALAELGLEDHHAPRDLRDLRNLLTSWRRIRREAGDALISFGVRALLVFIVAVAAVTVFLAGFRF